MLQKNKMRAAIIPFLQFFFVLLSGYTVQAQLYYHNFGTTTITTHPYTVAPTTLNSNLSGSSWSNSTNSWTSNTGASGQAIMLFNSPGTTTVTLTFNVAAMQQVAVTSFNFWRQRSNSGPQSWQMSINGIDVGSGTIPTVGAPLGTTTVASPVSGLTGTVTVVLTLTGATGNGNVRIDDFTLNGSVTSTCTNAVVSSYSPHSGPKDTVVTILGNGFTDTSSVKFDGISATFTVISDTEIQAMVPAGTDDGIITVTATDGCTGQGDVPFSIITSDCTSPEIYISEIYDAYSSTPGSIELYNPGTQPVNLSGYRLLRYGDIGDSTPSYDMALSGTINPGSCFMVSINIAAACPGVATDYPLTNGINANDEFELLKNNVLIDNVQIPFGSGDLSGRGYTMIRKPDAVAPKPEFSLPDWNAYGDEFCSNLGIHTANPISAPLPLISQPAPATICVNANATFQVTIIPSTGFTYQWKMLTSAGTWINVTNGGTYGGATTPTLTINGASLAMNGNQYYLEATSADCVVRTDAAQLYVLDKPAAPTVTVTQPTCTTPTGSIAITAPTGPDLTYSINGVAYQAGTTFSNLTPGATYSITVKNSAGCVSNATTQAINAIPGAPAAPAVSAIQPDCTTPTGSLTITNPGGIGYTYSIDGVNYLPGTSFNNLAPGPYSVTVKNAGGCVSPATSQTIDPAPAIPTAPTVTAVQPACTTATGSITVLNPTGNGLTYSIDGINYQPETSFNNLVPAAYTVTVKNASGCVSPATSQTITPSPATPIAPIVTAVQPNCITPSGSITVSNPTGIGLTYSIDGINYQSALTFNDLAPASYSVTVKNIAGCISPATSQTIDPVPVAPAAPTVTAVPPACNTSTGSITVTNPTGAGLTYSIDGVNYQPEVTFNNLAPGPYSITVKNGAGCVSAATSQTIDPAPAIPATPVVTAVQPTCIIVTGSITVSNPTGTDITYSIDGINYQPEATFNNLTPGPYSVTARNAEGCVSPATSQTIDPVPDAPANPTVTAVQPDCTTPTGSITVTNPTGAGLTYSIDGANYQSEVTFNNLAPGPYTITAKNAAGCVSPPTSQTIDTAPVIPPAPTVTATQPDCTSVTGSITVTYPTGAGLSYSIDGINYQTNPVFTTVATGDYPVTVRNAAGCTSPATSRVINTAPAVPAAPAITAIHPGCTTATGSITVTAPIGPGITYSIDGINYQTGATFANLDPGSYTITVKNAAGCVSAPTSQDINPQPETPAAPVLTGVQPSCTSSTGSITVTPVAGFTYSRDGINYQAANTFSNLSPGTYSITVKNPAGCVSPATNLTINPAPPVPVQPSVSAVQTTCTTTTGSITVTAPLGGGLTYSIDGINYQAGTIFANLAPGPYTITVKNTSGCISAPKTITINPVPALPDVPVLSVFHPGCNATKGSITVTSPAGNGISYSIDGTNYQVSATFTNLDPGNYTITAKNASGCISGAVTGTINNPPAIPAAPDVTVTQPDCNSGTGSIVVTSPVGAGLMYSVNSLAYQAETTFNNLAPGNYIITVRNAEGCVSGYTHFIINHPPLTPAEPVVSVSQPDCSKAQGTITVNSPVGFGLEYSIDGVNFQPSAIFNAVAPNTYNVTVRNSAGCTAVLTGITIDMPPAPAPDPGLITGDGAVCEGGTIQLSNTVTTGVWGSSNAAVATVDANGLVTALAPGSVTITYTTGTGCTASATKAITVHSLPQPSLRDMYLCVDNETGEATPRLLYSGISGAGYAFEWSKNGTVLPETSSTLAVDEPGDYAVTVTNTVTGCKGTSTATVGLSSLALGYAEATVDFQYNQTITVHITGGSGDYEYSLDGGPYQDENYFTGIYEGEYHITVRDKNGCGELELDVYALNYPRFFSPNSDGARDTWNIKGLANQPDARIYIFDRYGKLITGLRPGGPGWDGTYNGERLPATDYWFTVEYRSDNGENKEFKAHFSLLR